MADSSTSNLLSRRGLRLVVGYAVAVISVVVVFVAARALLYFHLPLAIMSFSVFANAIAFWYGEIGPGILALIVAVLIPAFLFQPEVDWISRITYDFVFLLFSAFMLQAS